MFSLNLYSRLNGSKVLPKWQSKRKDYPQSWKSSRRHLTLCQRGHFPCSGRHRGPVLIDLDETLYLRNSTEDFIDCAHPALAALLLNAPARCGSTLAVDRGRSHPRRVAGTLYHAVLSLDPFGLGEARCIPRRQRGERASHYHPQQPVRSAGLRSAGHCNGGLRSDRRAAGCGADAGFTAGHRRAALCLRRPPRGQGPLVVAKLGPGIIERALVLTDSEQDAELLAASAVPLRVIWPQARFRPAHSGVYLPGQYISQVKHRGERYLFRGILQEDFALWVLASLTFTQPLLHIVGLLFLLLSFWAIYERGYVDNDSIAARFEREPALSKAYFESPVATPRAMPGFGRWSAARSGLRYCGARTWRCIRIRRLDDGATRHVWRLSDL